MYKKTYNNFDYLKLFCLLCILILEIDIVINSREIIE